MTLRKFGPDVIAYADAMGSSSTIDLRLYDDECGCRIILTDRVDAIDKYEIDSAWLDADGELDADGDWEWGGAEDLYSGGCRVLSLRGWKLTDTISSSDGSELEMIAAKAAKLAESYGYNDRADGGHSVVLAADL